MQNSGPYQSNKGNCFSKSLKGITYNYANSLQRSKRKAEQRSWENAQHRPQKKSRVEVRGEATPNLNLSVNHQEPRRFYLNQKLAYGMTSLHLAILGDQLENVGVLIDRGVDIEVLDCAGKTPLHLAIAQGKKMIALLLMVRGANKEALCDDMTALHSAIARGKAEIVHDLINMGADKDALYIGMPPLHLAISRGKIGIANDLISLGADQNALYLGMKPLEHATSLGLTLSNSSHHIRNWF